LELFFAVSYSKTALTSYVLGLNPRIKQVKETLQPLIFELQRRQPHRGHQRLHRRALPRRRHQRGVRGAAVAAELTLCGEGGLKVVVRAPLEFRARASTRSGYVLVVVGKIDRGYTLLFVGKTILNTYNLIPSLEK
jgi:hypothetical protein